MSSASIPPNGRTAGGAPTCSVVICAYTELRWDLLEKGYQASVDQLADGDEVIVVIDHNPTLFARAKAEFGSATVIENAGITGLSGGRNTGVDASRGDVVIFLDDDAWPWPGWLAIYRQAFADAGVAVVAGAVEPAWEGGRAPAWFPPEFGWVVGCDFRGLPGDHQPIRNPIGANMAIRREVILAVGGFSTDVGRVGTTPAGCEETDLCIRISSAMPDLRKVRLTAAGVSHVVPTVRQRPRYFLSRCFHEGRSKRILAARVGADDGLGTERSYVTRTLTSGFVRGLVEPLRGRFAGPVRSLAIAVGLLATATGYLIAARPAPTAAGAVQDQTPTSTPEPQEWTPLRVVDYDIDAVVPTGEVDLSDRVRLLVISGGAPIGFLDIESAEGLPDADEVARRMGVSRRSTGGPVQERASSFSVPMVSVVIATRGRTDEVIRCVDSVLAQDYSNYEVLVIDNNDDPLTLPVVLTQQLTDVRLRIVHEARRGASVARNRGTREAKGSVIAATDDDVVASSTWLAELVAALEDPTVDCVTGLVVAQGFQTPAQELFEEFGGFSKGFAPARFDLRDHRSEAVLYPYSAGVYGSGNNVAFRKKAVEEVGGSDDRLGPGTLVKSGEDLDLFLKFLFAGKTLVYQPRARLSHSHRRTMDELHEQIRHYGRGLSAVMLKWALSDPQRMREIVLRVPAGVRRLLDSGSDRNVGRSAAYPASLSHAELRGLVEGSMLLPLQFLRARRSVDHSVVGDGTVDGGH